VRFKELIVDFSIAAFGGARSASRAVEGLFASREALLMGNPERSLAVGGLVFTLRSSRHAQVWLASIYNYDCGVGLVSRSNGSVSNLVSRHIS
jgi:hypothetical protein